ncbi:MAG TPA: serine/threonine-protein kinase [Gemmatimonadales bacterium]|nr:serine/threonine-protein kinase [Gemmatimonadales bacterium]
MDQHQDLLATGLRDRYRIDAPLGQGGMATVYRAQDLRHDRPVALKVLRPELAGALGPDRFLREIRVTARLDHPGILPIFDSGETAGLLWYAMPLVVGDSLRAWLGEGRKLPVAEATRIAREVAEALAYAHGSGVIHRDIKPENILLRGSPSHDRTSTAGWHPVIADFGIAHLEATAGDRLTSTGFTLGTPTYMSPEQAAGNRDVDGRTDVYALGCVLYEMICGEPPYTGANAQAILARQLTEAPRPPHVTRPALSPGTERIVLRSLAREPADRFQSAEALAEALAKDDTAGSTSPSARRWPGAALLAAGIAVLVLGGVLLRGRRGDEPPAAPVDQRVVAILPFVPSSGDTALSRLGRDLVFTLSATLDGVADLRTADPHSILALSTPQSGVRLADSAAALARHLGAGLLVEGSLVRIGGRVRADVTVKDAASGERLARASAEAPADSISRFTDSLAVRLLPKLLPSASITTGSLEGALRTRSIPALREFLTGERLLAISQFDEASAAYARALEADPAFWLALSRRVFSEEWMLNPTTGPLIDTLIAHANELPSRERLEIEARAALGDTTFEAALALHEELVRKYPTSWFGWVSYADPLTHQGPIAGRSLEEARDAWRRVVALNPRLVFAWDHVGLIAALERDSVWLGRALAELERADPRPMDEYANQVLSFRLLDRLVRGDSAGAERALDSVIADKVLHDRRASSFYDPLNFGFPEWQRRLAEAMIEQGSRTRIPDYREMLSMSHGAANRWDSALASAPDPLRARRIELFAAALGERPLTAGRSSASQSSGEAEWSFLDGVAAAMNGRARDVAAARQRLQQSSVPGAPAAAEALAAHLTALSGDTAAAGRALAALEWRRANLPNTVAAGEFPSVTPLNRIFAARWVAASGNAAEAGRLLRFIDAPFSLIPSASTSAFLREDIKRLGRELGAAP